MDEKLESTACLGPRRLVHRRPSLQLSVYSICTMVTRWEEYATSRASFEEGGFHSTDCEYLTIDNSNSNATDAYVSINEFLQTAAGTYIIVVHQDVVLLDHGRAKLDTILAELSLADPRWGVCGNAGHYADGWPAICISHPYKERHIAGGPFPARVVSLDENFMIIRRVANLAVSADLTGFHHYGADLCLVADILGWTAYVIKFFLRHNSGGTLDTSYYKSEIAISSKYRRALRPRWMHLITRRSFFISGRPIETLIARCTRYLGKVLGFVPRHSHLDDERRLARREKIRHSNKAP